MSEKKIPVSLLTDGVTVCGDTKGNDVTMIIVAFKDGKQLTYFGEEANKFMLHYLNGVSTKELSRVELPKAVEWKEVKKLQ